MPPYRPALERFWEKVQKPIPSTSECWIWTATKVQGYGWFHVERSRTAEPAYRFSYRTMRGAIPDGMELHHVCRNRACVNPWHLEAHTKATHPDSISTVNSQKTHCPKGHPYDEKNTYIHSVRKCRCCRMCATIRNRIRNGHQPRKKGTHCSKGHPYSLTGNTQYCKICHKESRARRKLNCISSSRGSNAVGEVTS